MPLAGGGAVFVTALAQDALTLRRRLDAAITTVEDVSRPPVGAARPGASR